MTFSRADVDFHGFPERENVRARLRAHRLDEVVKNIATVSSKRIGELVRQRRRANHLTQRQLCELSGVGLRLVSELERGKTTLRMDAANRVLAAFGMMLGPVEAPRSQDGE